MSAKKTLIKFILQCLFTIVLIFSIPQISFSAQPGLHVVNWNTFTWTYNSASPATELDHDVQVIDYDGIADDGSSHTVTVTYPDSTTDTLWFNYKKNDHAAVYSLWDNNYSILSGNYVYQVTDVNTSEWGEMTDNLTFDPVNPPDETSFSPGFDITINLTAHFDNVYVNGVLYDDFESGFDPNKWAWQPNEVTYENGELCIEKTYFTPSGSVWFQSKDIGPVNEIRSTVRAGNISGTSSKARISGTFWQEGGNDVDAKISIREDEVTYNIGMDPMVGGHITWKPIVDSTSLGPISQGNNYDLSMQWDGTTLRFHVLGLDDSVNYTAAYTPSGPVSPASSPGAMIGIARHLVLDTTTPEFSWDIVPGSEFYRVRLYALDENWNHFTIYRGYSKEPPFTLPPGILKPSGYYKYRIEAFKDHQWFEADNVGASDRDKMQFIAGHDEARNPYVDLHSIGVETWTNDPSVGAFTDFYIKINDAQGVPGNIASVKALLPDLSTEINLFLDYNDSSTCGIYRGHYFGTIQPGEYKFTVMDKDGNSHAKSENLTANPIAPPSEASLQPPNNTVIGGTGVNFDWDDVSGAAFYQLKLYDKDLNYQFEVETTQSQFKLPSGILEENTQYRYRIYSRREFFEDNTDNGSSVPESTWSANTFFTTKTNGTALPGLNLDNFGVMVWHVPHPGTGAPVYKLEFMAMVTDSDGVPENIEKVEVTYPDGTTTSLLKYVDMPDWGSNYLAEEHYSDPSSIPTGTYTFRVKDFDGHEVTLQDTLTDVVSNILPWPTNVSPADGTVFNTTTPTISWDPVSGASYYKVRIMSSWTFPTVHWSSELTQTQYTIPSGILEPDTTYGYRVYAYREPIGREVDFYSSNHYWHSANQRFTIGEACPCDINHDNVCDMQDWLRFGEDWGRTAPGSGSLPNDCECDLNRDGVCDMQDWLKFGKDWGRTDCP